MYTIEDANKMAMARKLAEAYMTKEQLHQLDLEIARITKEAMQHNINLAIATAN